MIAEAIDDVEGADVPHTWSCVERRLHSFSRWRLCYSSPWHGSHAVDHMWTQPDNIPFASELGASSAPTSSKWKTLTSDVQRSIAYANDCLAKPPPQDDRSLGVMYGVYDRLYLDAMDLRQFVRQRIGAATVAGCKDLGEIAVATEITPTGKWQAWLDDPATQCRRIPSAVRALTDALERVERWVHTPNVSTAGWVSPSLLVGTMPQTAEGWANIFRAGVSVVLDVSVRGPRDELTGKGPLHLIQRGVDLSLCSCLLRDDDDGDDAITRSYSCCRKTEMEKAVEQYLGAEWEGEWEREKQALLAGRPPRRWEAAEVLHFPVARVPGTAAWIDEIATLKGATRMPPVPLSECVAAIQQRIAEGHKVQFLLWCPSQAACSQRLGVA